MQISLKHHTHTNISRPQDGFVDRLSTDPYLDWMLIIIFTAVVALIGIGVGFVTYSQVQDRLSVSPGPAVQQTVFDREILNSIIKRFDDMKNERSSIIDGSVPVASDPSL